MSQKLWDLIANIRRCKTASDERAVITQECANIRNVFKNNDTSYRPRCVAKLLFINMLGFPTHFGQMECLKLIASNVYAEKRIGYLGLSQILDENSEVLMLVTNSIKNDLDKQNQYINALALSALGNIASIEMCRTLSNEIKEMMSYTNPYIKKKAALCAMKIMRNVDEYDRKWSLSISNYLQQKNHGVILAGSSLLLAELEIDENRVEEFRHFLTVVVQTLKRIVNLSHTQGAEYEIHGIKDPFLQTRLMHIIRLLTKDSSEPSEEINDVLAQIATNTTGGTNVDHAILYECVKTIITINSDPALTTLGINVLGRFLQNKVSNLRYVALCLLQQVVKADFKAVQRHRETIMDCLSDTDISIRRRALDVTYLLINEDNIKVMTKELLNCLLSSEPDFKGDIVAKICIALDRYSPSKRWHIEILIKIMCLAGNYIQEEVRDTFVNLVVITPELRATVVYKVYYSLKLNLTQEALVQVAVWCIGEFGELLTQPTHAFDHDIPNKPVNTSEVLDLLDTVTKRTHTNSKLHSTNEFVITALTKLAVRYPHEINRIRKMLKKYETSLSIDIQQRTCEYQALLSDDFSAYRSALFERIPITDNLRSFYEVRRASHQTKRDSKTKSSDTHTHKHNENELLDLLDMGAHTPNNSMVSSTTEGSNKKETHTPPSATHKPTKQPWNDNFIDSLFNTPNESEAKLEPLPKSNTAQAQAPISELLEDLFPLSISDKSPPKNQTTHNGETLDNLFSTNGNNEETTAVHTHQTDVYTHTHFPPKTVYNEEGLKVDFNFEKSNHKPTEATITAQFTNSTHTPMTSFMFEVAVANYIELKMLPTNVSTLPPTHTPSMEQKFIVNNTQRGNKKLAIRLRISYTQDNQQYVKMVTVMDLPENF